LGLGGGLLGLGGGLVQGLDGRDLRDDGRGLLGDAVVGDGRGDGGQEEGDEGGEGEPGCTASRTRGSDHRGLRDVSRGCRTKLGKPYLLLRRLAKAHLSKGSSAVSSPVPDPAH